MILFALAAMLSTAFAADPCKGEFSLQVVVSAAQPINSSDIGVKFELKKGAARAIASRIHTEEESSFSREACSQWHAKYWHVLERVLFENKSAERLKMACLNVAAVSYRIAGKKQSAQICLGDGRDDAVTYAFRRFYEGTDELIGR